MALSTEERRELLKLKEQGKSAFELKAALGAIRLGQKPQFEEKIAPRKTFLDNRIAKLKETVGDIKETVTGVTGISEGPVKTAGENIYRKAIEKDRNLFQKGVGIGSEVFRGGAGVVGELVIGAGKVVLPQEAEEAIAGKVEEIAEDIGSTEFVQDILNKYESLNPETKRQVDNILGYSAGLTEVIGLGGASRLSKPILKVIGETVDEATKLKIITKEGVEKVVAKGITKTEEISKKITGKKRLLDTEELNFLAQPKLTKRLEKEAIEKGELVDATALRGSFIKPSAFDKDVAKALSVLKLTTKDTPVSIFDKVRKRVKKNDTFLKRGLKDSNIKYELGELDNAIQNGSKELEILFSSDANAKNTFDAVKKAFLKEAEKQGLTLENLFIGRQAFDKIPAVKKLLDSSPIGESLRKEIVLNVRGSADNYLRKELSEANIFDNIAQKEINKLLESEKARLLELDPSIKFPKTPKMEKAMTEKLYKDILEEQSRLLTARNNLAAKEAANIGKSRIDKFFDQYPSLKRVAPTATGFITGGALF